MLFRRTALTSPLPEPITADAAELAELRKLLNVDDDSWPLVLGYLVASLIPGIPHPILMLGGEQGTGKTTAARVLAALIDPSPAPTRSEPRDPEQWAIASSGSWVVVIDNVSHIAAWFSDALCKAVTGDGLVRRKLYTDSDLAVLAFKRCIILTSIDPGAMRGDLGDRLVLVDLTRIQDKDRRTEAELHATYERARPRLLGALLSVLSRTLAELPNVKLATMPRMADFAQVLAALDRACPELTGGRALDLFVGQRQRIAGEVVESDAVAAAVLRLMESRGRWSGTSGELLTALTPERAPKGWPTSPRGMSGYLRRIVPALRALGVEVQFTRSSDGRRSRLIEIEKRQERPSEPPEASENMADVGETAAHRGPTDTKAEDAVRPLADRPAGNGDGSGPQDGLDGSDGFCHGIPVTDDGRQRGWV